MKTIRILLVEDNRILREGIAAIGDHSDTARVLVGLDLIDKGAR